MSPLLVGNDGLQVTEWVTTLTGSGMDQWGRDFEEKVFPACCAFIFAVRIGVGLAEWLAADKGEGWHLGYLNLLKHLLTGKW